MKKKLLLAGAAVIVAAAAVTGFRAYSKINVSDLLNANVEALTGGESGMTCYNTITFHEGSYTFYCGTCSYIPGSPIWSSSTGSCN